MKKMPKKEYTPEFKELAVKRVKAGQSVSAVARKLWLIEQTLRNWVKSTAAGKLNGSGSKVLAPEQTELSRVRAEPMIGGKYFVVNVVNVLLMLCGIPLESIGTIGRLNYGASELYFPVFIVVAILINFRAIQRLSQNSAWVALSLLVIAYTVPRTVSPGMPELAAATKIIYLYVLSLGIAISIHGTRQIELVPLVTPVLALMLTYAIIVSTALAGSGMVDIYYVDRSHPYWGKVRQLFAMSLTPNNLAMLLTPALIFSFLSASHTLSVKRRVIGFGVSLLALIALLLTQSKTTVLGASAILFCIARFSTPIRKSTIKRILLLTSIALVGIYIVASHFVALSIDSDPEFLVGPYVAKSDHRQVGDFTVFESQYLELKRIAIYAFRQSPILGLGLGHFNQFASDYAAGHALVLHTENPLPHSLYFGILSEGGLLAMSLLIVMVVTFFRMALSQVRRGDEPSRWAFIGLSYFLLEGINTDVQYSRYFWILVGAVFSVTLSRDSGLQQYRDTAEANRMEKA